MPKPTQPIILSMAILITLFGLLGLSSLASPSKAAIPLSHSPRANNLMAASLQITFTPVATNFLPIILRPDSPPPSTPPPTPTASPTVETPTATATTQTPTATATTQTPTATATDITTADVRITFIEYDPVGSDAEGEYVDLQNFGQTPATMTGWTLRDEIDTVYTFPTFSLGVQSSVRVWVRNGPDDASNLYWGRNSATWNNDGDTAILRNSEGTEIDQCSYLGGGNGVVCE